MGLVLATAAGPAAASPRGAVDPASELGANDTVFDPSPPVAEMQAEVDAVDAQQEEDEFGEERYALLLQPGTYGTDDEPRQIEVDYRTEVAGLGASPDDVTLDGEVEVYSR